MKKLHRLSLFTMILGFLAITAFYLSAGSIKAEAAAISINDKSIILENGHYKTLRISGTTSKATWSSSNSKVAIVNSNGRVTAKASGTTTITARVNGKTLTTRVRVIQISKKTMSLAENQVHNLVVWGADNSLTWSSSNPSVATVTKDGKVTAVAPGKTTIYANVNGKELTCTVSVLEMNHSEIVLENGAEFGFIKTLSVPGTTDKINWTSNNPAVAVVDRQGIVTARGAGTAVITANVNGAQVKCTVKILDVNVRYLTLVPGGSRQIQIYGTTDEIYWYSNFAPAATVTQNGVITAVAPGKATVYGEVEGRSVRIYVTVK